jgi:anti-sigma regulatory factor (Ser/Thr protein kinase)
MEQRIRLEPNVRSAREARLFVDRSLQQWDGPEARRDAVLLVNELVVNAIQHAGTPVEVQVAIEPDIVEVAVRDESSQLPELRRPKVDEERGRGLLTVDEVAQAWGVKPEPNGKAVWFRLGKASSRSTSDAD